MSTIEILDDLFFIERGYLNCNHLVYRSPAPVLIDSAYIGDFAETEDRIQHLGVNIADVAQIISTHTHCDHIGGNSQIQQRSGCAIALHKIGKHFIDTQDDWATSWKYYDHNAEFFKCTQSLEEGDTIHVGPHAFQVMYTPGHAADGIVLYNRKEKILISSDTLWGKDMSIMTLRLEGSTALFQRLDGLRKLESLDVNTVYPGHGKPFGDFKEAVAKTRERIERFLLDRQLIGDDVLKKLIIFMLLIKKSISEKELFPYLMRTHWFKETVDFYFDGDYEQKYEDLMRYFLNKGLVKQKEGSLYTVIHA
ncbi:MAG: MBL fold metallo-hydrolase [Candidatus Competibacteraceae bacterium]|nr:MBL fold metallo-hydrolase [Candidatus Competibacteraceae bacterium]